MTNSRTTDLKIEIEKITNESVRIAMLNELTYIESIVMVQAPHHVWDSALGELEIDVDGALYEQDQEELETLAKAHIVIVLGWEPTAFEK